MMNLGGLGFEVFGEGFLCCSNFDCNGEQQTQGRGFGDILSLVADLLMDESQSL